MIPQSGLLNHWTNRASKPDFPFQLLSAMLQSLLVAHNPRAELKSA